MTPQVPGRFKITNGPSIYEILIEGRQLHPFELQLDYVGQVSVMITGSTWVKRDKINEYTHKQGNQDKTVTLSGIFYNQYRLTGHGIPKNWTGEFIAVYNFKSRGRNGDSYLYPINLPRTANSPELPIPKIYQTAAINVFAYQHMTKVDRLLALRRDIEALFDKDYSQATQPKDLSMFIWLALFDSFFTSRLYGKLDFLKFTINQSLLLKAPEKTSNVSYTNWKGSETAEKIKALAISYGLNIEFVYKTKSLPSDYEEFMIFTEGTNQDTKHKREVRIRNNAQLDEIIFTPSSADLADMTKIPKHYLEAQYVGHIDTTSDESELYTSDRNHRIEKVACFREHCYFAKSYNEIFLLWIMGEATELPTVFVNFYLKQNQPNTDYAPNHWQDRIERVKEAVANLPNRGNFDDDGVKTIFWMLEQLARDNFRKLQKFVFIQEDPKFVKTVAEVVHNFNATWANVNFTEILARHGILIKLESSSTDQSTSQVKTLITSIHPPINSKPEEVIVGQRAREEILRVEL